MVDTPEAYSIPSYILAAHCCSWDLFAAIILNEPEKHCLQVLLLAGLAVSLLFALWYKKSCDATRTLLLDQHCFTIPDRQVCVSESAGILPVHVYNFSAPQLSRRTDMLWSILTYGWRFKAQEQFWHILTAGSSSPGKDSSTQWGASRCFAPDLCAWQPHQSSKTRLLTFAISLQFFTPEDISFQEKILERSGLGDETGLSDGTQCLCHVHWIL